MRRDAALLARLRDDGAAERLAEALAAALAAHANAELRAVAQAVGPLRDRIAPAEHVAVVGHRHPLRVAAGQGVGDEGLDARQLRRRRLAEHQALARHRVQAGVEGFGVVGRDRSQSHQASKPTVSATRRRSSPLSRRLVMAAFSLASRPGCACSLRLASINRDSPR